MSHIGTAYTKGAGYFRNYDPDKGTDEADIRTCTHCQAIIKMQQWRDEGAWCSKCFAPICVHCGAQAVIYGCVPFNKRIEQFLERDATLQQHMRVAGLDPARTAVPIFTGLITNEGK